MKKFQKVVEDFVCENCGLEVKGSGYTDHCYRCLWGKHVDDKFPGDRASGCRGLMIPIRVEVEGDKYNIFYKCQKCGKNWKNKSSKEDNFEEMLKLSQISNALNL